MGLLGSQIGGAIGQGIGTSVGNRYLGAQGGKTLGEVGKILGTAGGLAFPMFKNGGKVKKTGLAYVHKNEHVLPAGIKLTKTQKAEIRKRGGKM